MQLNEIACFSKPSTMIIHGMHESYEHQTLGTIHYGSVKAFNSEYAVIEDAGGVHHTLRRGTFQEADGSFGPH